MRREAYAYAYMHFLRDAYAYAYMRMRERCHINYCGKGVAMVEGWRAQSMLGQVYLGGSESQTN